MSAGDNSYQGLLKLIAPIGRIAVGEATGGTICFWSSMSYLVLLVKILLFVKI